MEIMSSKEVKIRSELEMDVERELEEEIKEGICHLALRLHRLYQQQKERNAKDLTNFGIRDHQKGSANSKILSEVNINIKMEGGTKIEIKEIRKQSRDNRLIRTPKTDNLQGIMAVPPPAKNFEWAKSLRSAPSSNIDYSRQSRLLGSKAKSIAPQKPKQQHKTKMGVNKTMLELGWKDK